MGGNPYSSVLPGFSYQETLGNEAKLWKSWEDSSNAKYVDSVLDMTFPTAKREVRNASDRVPHVLASAQRVPHSSGFILSLRTPAFPQGLVWPEVHLPACAQGSFWGGISQNPSDSFHQE